MNEASLVESIRHRVFLRQQGLELLDSKCTKTDADLIRLNYELVTGQTGWRAVMEFYDLLRASEDDDCWMPFLTPRLQYSGCFDLIAGAMCNSWRRLVLPYQCLPWGLFHMVYVNTEEAMHCLRDLQVANQDSGCSGCQDPSFSELLFKFVLANGLSQEQQQQRTQEVQQLLQDVLRDLPASTVQVEKLHANVQSIFRSDRAHAPRQKTVHVDSYLLAARQQHECMKTAVERDIFGEERGKVLRVLSGRVVQSSAPTTLTVRKAKKTQLKPRPTLADVAKHLDGFIS